MFSYTLIRVKNLLINLNTYNLSALKLLISLSKGSVLRLEASIFLGQSIDEFLNVCDQLHRLTVLAKVRARDIPQNCHAIRSN